MINLEKYTNDIKQLCEKHKVKSLYAFGSVLTDNFNHNSDIDFIVDFKPLDLPEYADNYYNLKYALENVVHRQVDLLEEKAIKNPYFKQAVKDKRQLVYGY